MSLFFFKSGNSWVLGQTSKSFMPTGSYMIDNVDATTVDIIPIDVNSRLPMYNATIATEVKKNANGDFYASVSELTAAVADFFGNASSGGGGGSTIDRELVTVTYLCKNAFTGASIGDTITMTQVIDVTSNPTTVSTIWRNQTTAADLASAPSASNLDYVGSSALTNTQLRASNVPVSISSTEGNNVDADVVKSSGVQPTEAYGMMFNGISWDRIRGSIASGLAVDVTRSDLPTGAATSAKQAELKSTIPTDSTPAVPVRQVPSDLWRCGFAQSGSGVVTSDMVLISQGSNMTVNQAQSNLVITTGTDSNSSTLIRSSRAFTSATIARVKTMLSQRIVNQSFTVALADLIGEGLAYTTNVDGSQITVTIPGNTFTSANIGQSINLGAISGVGASGRYAIVAVSGNNVTFQAIYSATWSRSTTTATITLIGGGGQDIIIGQSGVVSGSSDTAAIVNGAITVVAATGTTFTFTCLNSGATTGTLTFANNTQVFAASASGTLTLWGWNTMRTIFRDTSATTTLFDIQRNGWGFIDTAATINTSAVGSVLQMQTDCTLASLSDSTVSSTTSYQFAARASRIENIIDDYVPLYFFISVRNASASPASSTTLTIGFISVESVGNNKVHIAGSTQSSANMALPVQLMGGTTVVTVASSGISVVGKDAHSAASSGNAVRISGKVVTAPDITLVAGDVSDLSMTSANQVITKDFASSESDFQVLATVTTSTQTAIKAAAGASIRNYVTCITYQNTNATATVLSIQDASTNICQISAAASMVNPVTIVFPTPLKTAANAALNYTAGTTGANILLNVQGYQSF